MDHAKVVVLRKARRVEGVSVLVALERTEPPCRTLEPLSIDATVFRNTHRRSRNG